MTPSRRALFAAGVMAVIVAASVAPAAHRPVVSPYTYHRDVRPILERRCGTCHGNDSVSVPLLRFEDARPLTWPIRQTLMSGHMPPWFAEGDAIQSPDPMSARELNLLMTWSAGGAPEGARVGPATEMVRAAWNLGAPDLILAMPAPFTLAPNIAEATHEVALSDRRLRGRLVRAIDLLPGAAAIARRAEVVVTNNGREQVVALWQPGDVPPALSGNAAFRIPSNGALTLRMHYQQKALNTAAIADRSEIGLYFAPSGAKPVTAIELSEPEPTAADRLITRRIATSMQAVAVRPIAGPDGARVAVTLVRTDGSRLPLARLQLREGWNRRYAFTTPVRLAANSRIEARVTAEPQGLWTTLTGQRPSAAQLVRFALEVID